MYTKIRVEDSQGVAGIAEYWWTSSPKHERHVSLACTDWGCRSIRLLVGSGLGPVREANLG